KGVHAQTCQSNRKYPILNKCLHRLLKSYSDLQSLTWNVLAPGGNIMTSQLFREFEVEGNVSGDALHIDTSNHKAARNGSAPKNLPIAIINRQLLSSECLARAICSSSDLQVVSFSTLD